MSNNFVKSKFVYFIAISILATVLSRASSQLKIIPILFLWYYMIDYCHKYIKQFRVKGYGRFLFFLFCFYCLFLILKAVFYDSNIGILGNFYTSFFGNLEFGLLSFLIFCCVFVVYEQRWLESYVKACDIILCLGIAVGILYLLKIDIEPYVFLLYLLPFLCLREIMDSGKKVCFITYSGFSLYYCWFEDERSILMMCVLSIVVMLLFLIKSNVLFKSIKIYCLTVPVVGIFLTIYNLSSEESFFEYLYHMYSDETTIVQDTRTFLFQELREDLTNTDTWLLGKGMFGTYYSEVMYVASKRGALVDNTNRLGTECGYLWLILKGGIIYFFLFFLLFYFAIVRAIKEATKVSVYIGFIIASRLLFMFISFTPAFDVANIFLWSLFGFVVSSTVKRKMPLL